MTASENLGITQTQLVDGWIERWALSLDESGRFIKSDGRTIFQRAVIDKHQVAIRARLLVGHGAPKKPTPAAKPKNHMLPTRNNAFGRLAAARSILAAWKAKGLAPRVQWEPIVQIVSGAGEPLQHPAGCLVEMLWILRDERPSESVADSVNRHMMAGGPGGAA